MTIFDYLKDIVVEKKGNLPLDNYVPFLVHRWLSFINPTVCLILNEFNLKTLFEDKNIHYKTMVSLFPKRKYLPKIAYIKKATQESLTDEEKILCENQDQQVKNLSERLELSEREVRNLIAFQQSL